MGHDLAIIIVWNLFFIGLYGIDTDVIVEEKILGFSITQIHNVFSEMEQSPLICNLYGFGEKTLVD